MSNRRRPPSVLFPQPEGEAGSVRTVDQVAGTGIGRDRQPLAAAVRTPHGGFHRSDSQESLESTSVKPRHHLVADHDHRHGHAAGSTHEVRPGRFVLGNVLRLERYALLRKKLFRRVARLSGARPVNRHVRAGHARSSSSVRSNPCSAPARGVPA